MILPVCYFIFSTSRHWHYWYLVGENKMDDTRLQDFLAFAFDTYIRPSAISFPPRSLIHTSHSHSLLSIYPIYLSSPFALETIGNILVFFSVRCLLNQPSFSLSDSFIQLVPRKYIISYTHSIAITLIHHSSSSQFLFFLHTPRRIQDSKILCIYIHTLHCASPCCGFAVDTFFFPLLSRFSFLSHPFVLLHSRVFMDH